MRRHRERTRRPGLAAWAFVVFAVLALAAQALAPMARAYAAPLAAGEIAADLKATFGDAVQICVHVDDGAPAPAHPAQGCDDCCPLCALHAPAAVLPPEAPALAAPLTHATRLVRALAPDVAPPPARASPAQPRAPPFEV